MVSKNIEKDGKNQRISSKSWNWSSKSDKLFYNIGRNKGKGELNMNFEEGQFMKIKNSTSLSLKNGKYEVVKVEPTMQGSANIFLVGIKGKIKEPIPRMGKSLIERIINESKGSMLYTPKESIDGITGSSEWAENLVIKNIPRAGAAHDKSDGDVWKRFYIEDVLHTIKIEVKSSKEITKNMDHYQVNQVRPMKYHVLVIVVSNLSGFKSDCVVYPASHIAKTAFSKMGQHTVDAVAVWSFQCKPSHEEKFGCSFGELNDSVKDAYLKDHVSEKGMEIKFCINKRVDHYHNYILPENRKWAAMCGTKSYDILDIID
ncbi:hypothetical protein LCGC14_0731410 [marine sediment metagenome]|uniref:Uncharacterized protein n=1 Tax=marine sediment metagenome TaxID=412755 RepID=A0A0F9SUK7_9ZZZZ